MQHSRTLLALLAAATLVAPLSAQTAGSTATASIPARREFAHDRHIRMEYHAPSKWTIVELMPMALDGNVELRTSFRFPGDAPASPPATMTFALVGRGAGEAFAANPVLSLVLDGKAPVVVAAKRFAQPAAGGTTQTTIYATMPRATFLRLVNAQAATVRVDAKEWTLAPDMLEALRDLASRMSPAGYKAAKAERGMVAAAAVDTAGGAAPVYQANEVDAMAKPRGLLSRPRWPVDAPMVKRRVMFRYVVDSTGLVDVSTLRSETPKTDSLFVDMLKLAASRWAFTPARKDGRPVRVEIRQVYEFEPLK